MFDKPRHKIGHRKSFGCHVYAAVAGLECLPFSALGVLARRKGAKSATRAPTADSSLDVDEDGLATRLALVDTHIGT